MFSLSNCDHTYADLFIEKIPNWRLSRDATLRGNRRVDLCCYNPVPRGNSMGNVSSIIRQLKKERDRVAKQLSGMDAALTAFAGVYSGSAKTGSDRSARLVGRGSPLLRERDGQKSGARLRLQSPNERCRQRVGPR